MDTTQQFDHRTRAHMFRDSFTRSLIQSMNKFFYIFPIVTNNIIFYFIFSCYILNFIGCYGFQSKHRCWFLGTSSFGPIESIYVKLDINVLCMCAFVVVTIAKPICIIKNVFDRHSSKFELISFSGQFSQ